jgi:hypothetical protein
MLTGMYPCLSREPSVGRHEKVGDEVRKHVPVRRFLHGTLLFMATRNHAVPRNTRFSRTLNFRASYGAKTVLKSLLDPYVLVVRLTPLLGGVFVTPPQLRKPVCPTSLPFATMPATDSRSPSRQQTSYTSSFVRWLQLKKYQYEVTFSLYMLTPTEKLIFSIAPEDIPTICVPVLTYNALDFILLVLISMLITAATMYLPNHVVLIYNRIWYYVHGEFVHLKGNGGEVLKTPGANAVVSGTTRRMAETVATVMRKLDEL